MMTYYILRRSDNEVVASVTTSKHGAKLAMRALATSLDTELYIV